MVHIMIIRKRLNFTHQCLIIVLVIVIWINLTVILLILQRQTGRHIITSMETRLTADSIPTDLIRLTFRTEVSRRDWKYRKNDL